MFSQKKAKRIQSREHSQSASWRERVPLGLLCTLAAFLTTLALSISLTAVPLEESGALKGAAEWLAALERSWNGTGVIFLVLVVGLGYLYWKLWEHRPPFLPSAAMVALLFALFLVFGESYEAADSWDLLFDNAYQRTLAALMLAGFWVFFYGMVSALFLRLDRMEEPEWGPWQGTRKQIFRVYLDCFLVVLVFWLPYLLICYPGSVTYDGMYQLGQAFGVTEATNHHPWLSTLLMGGIVGLGKWEVGIFLYVLFQSLVCAAAFGAVCGQMWVQTRSRLWTGLTLAYYALVPTWGAYAQMFVKDTLFYGVFTAFFLCVVRFVQQRGRCHWSVWAGMFLFALLGALLRNNGLYVAVPSILLLVTAVGSWKKRGLLAAGAVAVLGIYMGWNQVLLPAWGVAPGSVREMLSLPFQQTARYVCEYEGHLLPEDIDVINEVLDYQVLLEEYNPCVSDPVKNTYHGDRSALKDYVRLWVRCGLHRPDVYVEAALNSMYGYFLPGYRYGSFGGNYFLMQESAYGVEASFAHPEQVEALDTYSRLWSVTPGLGLLNAPGTHSWLLILCTAALLRKKQWVGLLVTLPVWLTLGICCISPVNGLVRYMLPIMAVMPLLLFFTWDVLKKRNQKEDTPFYG